MTALQEVDDVVEHHAGLSRTVLEFTQEMKRLVDEAKQPGFDADRWSALGRFVAVGEFSRMGPFKDAMTWPEYVAFLTGWAPRRHWECSFRRITETGNLVFLELEERSEPGDSTNAVNSLSVYEFDEVGQLRHLDVYLQMAMPPRSASST